MARKEIRDEMSKRKEDQRNKRIEKGEEKKREKKKIVVWRRGDKI